MDDPTAGCLGCIAILLIIAAIAAACFGLWLPAIFMLVLGIAIGS